MCTFPNEPETSSYTLPASVKVTVLLTKLLSVSVREVIEEPAPVDNLLPEWATTKSKVPGSSFSLYLALSIEIA